MPFRLSKDRIDLDDKPLQRAVLKDYSEAVVTSNSGSSYTIDLENGNVFDITLTENCSFTFANPPASGTAGSFKLILTQDGTGGRTVTWPGAVEWVSGSAPTLNSDAGGVSILTFITTDGGTTWYGIETAVVQTSGDTVDRQVFTADGTWNKPSSGTVALVEAWGAGGAGVPGNPMLEIFARGGGGGEYVRMLFSLSDLGSSESVGVGVGGTSGGDGGDSTFGSHLTAEGGKGTSGGGVDGGAPGQASRFGGGGGTDNEDAGGDSAYGGAGGGNPGGTSQFGGDGGDSGSNGSAPGGGGGAGDTDGARGEVRVTVW